MPRVGTPSARPWGDRLCHSPVILACQPSCSGPSNPSRSHRGDERGGHKSRGGPTAWARSLSPRPPCPGTCRLRAEGLTTRWLPAPSVHAVSAAGPGSVCACPALRGKSPVDLPLRAPGRHLSAGFDCLPGLSANQRGLVSKRPTKTQK
ncbi:UNVERIFIED_CONTAM: hypothetical protein FKN15_056029 [Acipenser sinensis]